MKKIFGVVLFLASWVFLSGGLLGFFVLILSPPALQAWEPGETFKLFLYCCLYLLLGVLAVWGGMTLMKRWRIALGVIGIIVGLGSILEGWRHLSSPRSNPLLMEVISPAIVLLGLISGVIGMSLIISQKRMDSRERLSVKT